MYKVPCAQAPWILTAGLTKLDLFVNSSGNKTYCYCLTSCSQYFFYRVMKQTNNYPLRKTETQGRNSTKARMAWQSKFSLVNPVHQNDQCSAVMVFT